MGGDLFYLRGYKIHLRMDISCRNNMQYMSQNFTRVDVDL